MGHNTKENMGEGNREADRNYRKGVRDTVADTTQKERACKARDIDSEELEELREAEKEGRSPARS